MNLLEKVSAVEEVMRSLDEAVQTFQGWSGLGCKTGCGKCCTKADIEATVLEFLPLAVYLHSVNQAEVWLEKLSANPSEWCALLDPAATAGMCTNYKYRGLICRLFGYSARLNKHSSKELVTCQTIKSEQSDKYLVVNALLADHPVPVTSQYYMQLHAIDFEMAREFFPVNEAIKRALQVILHYYAYRS
jgi:Fe-S-cluster containining protein